MNNNDLSLNQFYKIRLINDMALDIIDYAVHGGHTQLYDIVDMNCGAIPDGDFENIIDPSSPQQFLSLYTKIAVQRFAMAVTETLKLSSTLIKQLTDYCYNAGVNISQNTVCKSIQEALSLLNECLLEETPPSNKSRIITQSDSIIIWESDLTLQKQAWEKCNGDVNNFYILQTAFVTGLLKNSTIKYTVQDNKHFTLSL